jgi:SOS-response transcriptional repressor LexA
MSNSEIYGDLMRFKPESLSANAWAVKAGVSRTVWADMRRHGNPSRRTLEKLLAAAGSSLAEFEALRLGPPASSSESGANRLGDSRRAWAGQAAIPLSVIATALAGEWGTAGSQVELTEMRPSEIVGRVARPASLAGDTEAFAVTVVGDSMWPRFRPGRLIAVAPRSPVAIGDDVLVRLRTGERSAAEPVLIKQLVKRTSAEIELRQFNPERTFSVGTDEVEEIVKILGELV